MAIGPNFKKGHTHQWIKLVDEYQIMINVLKNIQPEFNEGNWNRVKDMFR